MEDASDLKSVAREGVPVRVRERAPLRGRSMIYSIPREKLKEGDVVVADEGIGCIRPNTPLLVKGHSGGLYVECELGEHYLDGQLDHNYENYIGLAKVRSTVDNKIGRPGIGGEFLRVEWNDSGRVELNRYKQVNSIRSEKRQMGVSDLPAETMVYDLLSAIEYIVRTSPMSDIDMNNRGIDGKNLTLRERFELLSKGV